MAHPNDPARHWLLVQSDKPGVSAGGFLLSFMVAVPPPPSPRDAPREYITTWAGQQAGMGVIIAISS